MNSDGFYFNLCGGFNILFTQEKFKLAENFKS